MLSELRSAGRQLRRHPAFTITSILVLALGIGVAGAMEGVLSSVLLRPLPYAHPDQLVAIELPRDAGNIMGMASAPEVREWRERTQGLADIAYSATRFGTLQTPGELTLVGVSAASGDLFSTLGAQARLGRTLTAADEANRAHVAVLGDELWRTEFGARNDVLGTIARINGGDYQIVGVMPAGFSYPYGQANLWIPYAPSADEETADYNELSVIARLSPGVTRARAQAQIGAMQAGLARRQANLHLADRVVLRDYRDELVGGVRPALWALSAAVGAVWLIACSAVAGLLLMRLAGRRREMAVRAALGAARRQLATPLILESLLLAGAAALAGLLLSRLTLAALRAFLTAQLPSGVSLALDWRALLGLALLTAASVVAIGMAPAWLAARTPAAESLRAGASSGGREPSRLRDGLVVVEIALALVLLAGAGLMLRTLTALRRVPLGFATDNIVTTELLMAPDDFAHRNMDAVFDRPLLARIDALPGVQAAALTSVVPLQRHFTMTGRFEYIGRPSLPSAQQPQGQVRFVTPEYPAVFGIPLEAGRFFDPNLDTLTAPLRLVVNRAFAHRYFPGENAVGEALGMGEHKTATIIGVLADTHEQAMDEPPTPVMYFSTAQTAPGDDLYGMASAFATLTVRSRGAAAALIPALRSALHAVAPELAAEDFVSMRQIADDSIGSQILGARLLAIFALAALTTALAGLYGLLAYSVAQRRREMGIRMALGAERSDILGLVLGRALRLLALGLAGGLLLTLAMAHLLAPYLYGVQAHDPLTLAAVAALLGLAVLAAAWLPARRAAATSPTEALRTE